MTDGDLRRYNIAECFLEGIFTAKVVEIQTNGANSFSILYSLENDEGMKMSIWNRVNTIEFARVVYCYLTGYAAIKTNDINLYYEAIKKVIDGGTQRMMEVIVERDEIYLFKIHRVFRKNSVPYSEMRMFEDRCRRRNDEKNEKAKEVMDLLS